MLRCIGIGDNVCDLYRHLGLMFPGGQALNFAVYCRMLGQQSAYLGAFGHDAVGAHVKHTLDELQVDRSHCREYDGENGFAEVDLQNGDRVFLGSNKGGVLKEHPLIFAPDELSYLKEFDVIHTSNNSYMDDNLPLLAQLPGYLSYDFSGTWEDAARVQQVCQHLDFGFLSCPKLDDNEVYATTQKLFHCGCKTVVATRGARGACVFDGVRHYCFTPQHVDAVDTLGAGDSFAAGFLVHMALKCGHSLPPSGTLERERVTMEALASGAVLSARTCMTQGAFGYGTAFLSQK